jgi:ATPase subunit of ABC transporter with duplicated ATPase domains
MPSSIDELKKTKELLLENELFLDNFKDELDNSITSKTQEVSKLEGVNKVIAELQQRLSNINITIQETETKISDINRMRSEVIELKNRRVNLYSDIMRKMSTLRLFLQEAIDKFENGRDEILNKLQFVASVDMKSKDKYIQTLTSKLDNRKHSEDQIRDIFSEIFDSMETLMNGKEDRNNDEMYLSISRKVNQETANLNLKASISKTDYNNSIFHCFFGLIVNISFDTKSIDNLSMGERAIVLLKILLALDDTPLLIDQPEEHLDNRFIYDELKESFRSAKKRRQIIIATHNANLVINTDSEQIIIAKPDNGTIKYICGTIEDLSIREDITHILEGGEDAFKKREEKYGYKF